MSSTIERDVISEALRIIDRSLGWMHTRELVSTAEVSDLLLDMRSVLAAPSPIVDDLETVGVN
jgi:hypothetical protein